MNVIIDLTRAIQVFRFIRYGTTILIGILLTKSVLSIQSIGHYEWLMYVGSFVTAIWVNQLLGASIPSYNELSEEKQPKFIFSLFTLFFLIGLLTAGILYTLQDLVIPWLTGQESLPHFALFCIFIVGNNVVQIAEYQLIIANRPRHLIIIGGLIFLLRLIALVLPIYLTGELQYGILGLAIWGGLMVMFLFLQSLVLGKFNTEWGLVIPFLKFGGHLFLYSLIVNAAVLFDSWMIGYLYDDPGQFAIFRYGARELPLYIIMLSAVQSAALHIYPQGIDRVTGYLRKESNRLMWILFPTGIAAMFAADYIFPWVYRDEFYMSAQIFEVYLLLLPLRFIMPFTLILAEKKVRWINGVAILEFIINIVASFILAHYFGMIGIAFGTLIAYTVERVIFVWAVRHTLDVKLSEYFSYNNWLLFTILLGVAYLINNFVL